MKRDELFDISDLIFKSLSGRATPEESRRLEAWKGISAENQALYEWICSREVMRDKIQEYKDCDVQSAFASFVRRRERHRRIVGWVGRCAVILAFPLALALWYWLGNDSEPARSVVEVAGVWDNVVENRPVLTLSNGRQMVLGDSSLRIDGGNGVQITLDELGAMSYRASDSTLDVDVYNTLTTPVQCDFVFTLEDGTRVWLNAASSLRYPVAFKGRERVVHANGEVYFEVAKDENRPFYVCLNDSVRVRVLGTSFNVNSYADEQFTEVTLVEGRVRTYSRDGVYELSPSQQLYIDRERGTSKVRTVDAYDYVAWKDGQYVFKKKPLCLVAKVLQRWYGVEVVFESSAARKAMFTGVINKEESVRLFVKRLNETSSLYCRLEGKVIYIQ